MEIPPLEDLWEVTRMIEEQVIDWTVPMREEAWRSGVKEGLQQGEATALIRILERKFGVLAESTQQRIRSTETDTLLHWIDRALVAQRVEDVLDTEE